jgi:hypothetical protein
VPVPSAQYGNISTSVAQPSPITLQRTQTKVSSSINCSSEASADAVGGGILNDTELESVQNSSIALKPQYSERTEAYHQNPTNDHHGARDEGTSNAQVSGLASAQHLSWQLLIPERLDSANTTSLPGIENTAQLLASLANNKVSDSRDTADVAPEHPISPSDSDQLFENVLVSEDMNINPKDTNIIERQDESDPSDLGAEDGAEMIVEAMKSKSKIEKQFSLVMAMEDHSDNKSDSSTLSSAASLERMEDMRLDADLNFEPASLVDLEVLVDEEEQKVVNRTRKEAPKEREDDEFEADDEERFVDKPVFLSEKEKKALNRRTKKSKRRNPTLTALTSSP